MPIDLTWDDSPIDVTEQVNFIWGIANKLRGTYQSDKYKDVIIPMTIIRRFECALEGTKAAVVKKHEENPNFPAKAMCKISNFQFYNTSKYTLKELLNDPDNLALNFREYIKSFSSNVQDIIKKLDFVIDISSYKDNLDQFCVKKIRDLKHCFVMSSEFNVPGEKEIKNIDSLKSALKSAV